MNSSASIRRAFRVAVSTAILFGCGLGSIGCESKGNSRTAVIVPLDWDKVKEVSEANLKVRDLEIVALLDDDQEITVNVPIGSVQSHQLRDGARLLVKCKDKRYLEALVMIIPE
jgi:hypothetical protein